MSYEIIYGRQFIRTTRGIIPLILSGSNNCSMFYQGREIRERDWGVAYGDAWLERPEAELLEDAETRLGADRKDEECLVIGRKWVTCGGFLQYIRNGIKNAMTIEDVCRLKSGQFLRCMVSYCNKAVDSLWERELYRLIRSTPELERWIDEAREKKTELIDAGTNSYVSICISLQGIHPLGIERLDHARGLEGSVLAKRGNCYITYFGENSISQSADISTAMEFENIDAAKAMLPPSFGPYRFVSSRNKAIAAEKHYVLRITEGSYAGYFIRRLYSRSLQFTGSAKDAKRFATEAAANKWYSEHIGGARFPGVKAAEVVWLDGPEIGIRKNAG